MGSMGGDSRLRQFDTSPTQGWGKVGARSGQKVRFGQGWDKEIVIKGLISDRSRR